MCQEYQVIWVFKSGEEEWGQGSWTAKTKMGSMKERWREKWKERRSKEGSKGWEEPGDSKTSTICVSIILLLPLWSRPFPWTLDLYVQLSTRHLLWIEINIPQLTHLKLNWISTTPSISHLNPLSSSRCSGLKTLELFSPTTNPTYQEILLPPLRRASRIWTPSLISTRYSPGATHFYVFLNECHDLKCSSCLCLCPLQSILNEMLE